MALATAATTTHYSPSDFAERRHSISSAVVERLSHDDASARQAIMNGGRESVRDSVDTHLLYLAEAVAARSPALFRHYTEWAASVQLGRDLSPNHLRACYSGIADVLRDPTTSFDDSALALQYLDDAAPLIVDGATVAPSPLASAHPMATELLDRLLACRRQEAIGLIDAATASGTSILDIYLQVFQPVLREVGRRWQQNEISVAQEHYCSAAIQLMMGRLSDRIFSADRIGKTLVAACVGDELHEIGLRMVADTLEASGWDTHFLGANVPAPDLVGLAISTQADVVALSVTLTSNLSRLNDIIGHLRREPALNAVKIVVGGHPFAVEPDLWQKLGADGCARDAGHAVEVCTDLAGR